MEKEEGQQGEELAVSEFEAVEETYAEVPFEEFSGELELAFPEDTVAYEDLFDSDPTATNQSDNSDDELEDENGPHNQSNDDQPTQNRPSEPSSPPDLPDSLTVRLIDELEDDSISEQTIGKLREQLGVTSPQNVEVRLRHLQTQVSDLTAYIDALEAFLDDRGSAKQVLETVENEIKALDTRLNDLDRTHDANHAQLRGRIEVIEEDLNTQKDRLEVIQDLQRRVDDLETALEATDETIDATTNRVNALEGDVSSALTTIKQQQANLQEEIESIQRTHRQLVQAFTNSSQD